MVSSFARGKKIFTKLGKFSISNIRNELIDFTIGYPIRPEVIPGHLKVGWDIVFELPIYGKFISFYSFLSSRSLSSFTFVANFILKILDKIISVFRFKDNSTQIEYFNDSEIDLIDGLEKFFSNLNEEIPIYLLKTKLFLKWRLGAPGKKYSIIVLKKDNNIIAYSITTFTTKENVPCLGILDLVTLRGYEKYSSILLKECEKLAKKNNAELILTMISKNWSKKYSFLFNGFIKTPYIFKVILNNFNQSIEKNIFYSESYWHLMWIDSDNL